MSREKEGKGRKKQNKTNQTPALFSTDEASQPAAADLVHYLPLIRESCVYLYCKLYVSIFICVWGKLGGCMVWVNSGGGFREHDGSVWFFFPKRKKQNLQQQPKSRSLESGTARKEGLHF